MQDQLLKNIAREYGTKKAEQVAVLLNPYLAAYEEVRHREGYARCLDRDTLVKLYGFAIPNQRALDTIAKLGPVVEIGAGTGYWAWLLRRMGVDVLAYDKFPVEAGENFYFKAEVPTHTTVLPGDESQLTELARYGDKRNLFLCWPSYASEMADKALSLFEGNVLIYVGESEGGCTGDDDFFKQLESEWLEVECVDIPQWWGIHDCMWVYRRKVPR